MWGIKGVYGGEAFPEVSSEARDPYRNDRLKCEPIQKPLNIELIFLLVVVAKGTPRFASGLQKKANC